MRKPQKAKIERDADASWRMYPHTYAKKVSGGEWLVKPHLRHISIAIADAVGEGGGFIVVMLPPQHGKSELISHWTPTWFLDLFPHKRVILSSYESDSAAQWGRKVRNEIMRNRNVSAIVTDDSAKASRWDLTDGGGMITAGMDGAITGKSGDLIIVDDPIKNWKQAQSAAYREHCKWFFDAVLYTRRQPGTVFVVLMTSWHEEDLAHYLVNEHHDNWQNIVLPALAEENDPLGRKVDEALWPERYPADELIRQREGSPRIFAAMYQQRPSPAQGNIFKREWFTKRWTKIPDSFDRVVQSWDLTFGEGKNAAYNVGQTWLQKDAEYLYIGECRKKMEFTDQAKAIPSEKAKYPDTGAVLVEKAANGAAALSVLKTKVTGLIPVHPTASKIVRAEATTHLYEAGNVIFPAQSVMPWADGAVEEFVNFPNGKYKDRVDAASQALTWMESKKRNDIVIPDQPTGDSNWNL